MLVTLTFNVVYKNDNYLPELLGLLRILLLKVNSKDDCSPSLIETQSHEHWKKIVKMIIIMNQSDFA